MNTQQALRTGSLVLAILASGGTAALATPLGTTGQFNWDRQAGYFTGGGGEFTIYNYTGISNTDYFQGGTDSVSTKNIGTLDPSFQTFCLEEFEYASSPSYFVVNSGAVLGGVGGSPDPISKGTAYLYSQFAEGTLNVPLIGGYGDYFSAAAPARSDEAGALQNAIWSLEGEIGALAAGTNPYYDAALLNGGTADAPAGYLGVYVLNNFTTAAARDAFVASGTTSASTRARSSATWRRKAVRPRAGAARTEASVTAHEDASARDDLP